MLIGGVASARRSILSRCCSSDAVERAFIAFSYTAYPNLQKDERVNPPTMPTLGGDERQARASAMIDFNLIAMGCYVDDLPAAVELYVHAQKGAPDHLMACWQRFAAQQGIVAVYNYEKASKAVLSQLRTIKVLNDLVDHQIIESSRKRFVETFPDLSSLRQTVMHQSELMDTPKNFDTNKNRLNEGFGYNGLVIACMWNNVYTASHAGRQIEFDLSFEKAALFRSICEEFFSAFPAN